MLNYVINSKKILMIRKCNCKKCNCYILIKVTLLRKLNEVNDCLAPKASVISYSRCQQNQCKLPCTATFPKLHGYSSKYVHMLIVISLAVLFLKKICGTDRSAD